MSEPFLGEIRLFGFPFAPRGWGACNGQLLSISQNSALFSLTGTVYGGDGRTTFGLPDLRGRIAMHTGAGPGLSMRRMGQQMGFETHTLSANEMAAHRHRVLAAEFDGDELSPSNNFFAQEDFNGNVIDGYSTTQDTSLNTEVLTHEGHGAPHTNMMPYLVMSYCIALVGIYPSR